MQRYFLKKTDDVLVLENDDIFHLKKVMRSKKGDVFEGIIDGSVYLCKINQLEPFMFNTFEKLDESNELPVKVTVAIGLIKGDKMNYMIQKLVELGVYEIIFLNLNRNVVKISSDKLLRYSKIVKEAAEQSKRNVMPKVEKLLNLEQLSRLQYNHKLVAYENLKSEKFNFLHELSKVKLNDNMLIVFGPEGGLEQKEYNYLIENSYVGISLGKRILRAETAPLYCLSNIASTFEV